MELSNNEQQIKLKAARVPQHQNLSVNETQTQPQSQLPHHFKPKASFKKTREINAIDFNKTVPWPLIKEVRSEKIFCLSVCFLSFLTFLVSGFLIFLYFYFFKNHTINVLLGIRKVYVPNGYFMCLVSFISLVVFAYKMFCYQQVVIEIDAYYFALKQGEAPPPDFIIKNYEKLEVRKIILNWIAFSVYILGLLTLGLLLWLRHYTYQNFQIFFWSLGKVPNLQAEIIAVAIILAVMVFLHVFNLLWTKKRKLNIFKFCRAQLLSDEKLAQLRKRTNLRCLIVLVCVLLVTVILFLVIVNLARKQKIKSIFPFSKILGSGS